MTSFRTLAGRLTFGGRFNRDLGWNLASLAVLALAGVGINLAIGRFYGPVWLGVFNLVIAVYIFATQLAVGGFHFSAAKCAAQFADDRPAIDRLVSAALGLTLLLSAAVAGVVFGLRGWLGQLFENPGAAAGLVYILPGIVLFSLDKVLLGALNGLRHMRAFAVFNALRYVLICALLAAWIMLGQPGETLPLILTLAEAVLFVGVLAYALRAFRPVLPGRWGSWFREHLGFGFRSLPGGALLEINTRVDVVMLGIMASNQAVGIYSMAAIFAEGLSQLPVVLRVNLNPIMTRLHYEGRREDLQALARRGRNLSWIVMGSVSAVAAAVYPFLVNALGGAAFDQSGWVFGILALGVALAGGYLPFSQLLMQTGKPGQYTWTVLATVLSNIALNAALIPLWGIYGAAAATAAATLLGVLYLRWQAARKLGLRF